MLNIGKLKKWIASQIDQRIEKALKHLNMPTRDQVTHLAADIKKLEKKLTYLQEQGRSKKTSAELTRKELVEMLQEPAK